MTLTDLFSHPYEPEFVAKDEQHPEPVKLPEFSDRPGSDRTATGVGLNKR